MRVAPLHVWLADLLKFAINGICYVLIMGVIGPVIWVLVDLSWDPRLWFAGGCLGVLALMWWLIPAQWLYFKRQ